MKSKKKLYEYKLNKVNPFLDETIQHVEKGEKTIFMGSKKSEMLINATTGEVEGSSLFAKRIKVDKAQFAKIYVNNLASWFDLSKTGIRIFAYIVNTLKPNRDSFMMSYDDCMEYTGYKSKKSISDGVKELIDNSFIARGENQYIFFINPTVFFNGNRVSFLRQYEIVEENILKEEERKKLKK